MSAPAWLIARPIAHRGLHDVARGVIENTSIAGQLAARAGFSIECDVQVSADGEAVVFHDFTLDRLTAGQGRVDDLTARELAALSIKGSTERIITLEAYLDIIGGHVPLFIEIKSRFDGDLRLTRRVAELVNKRSDQVALMSFDPAIVEALQTLTPHHTRGIVAEANYTHNGWHALTDIQRHKLMNFLHINRSRPDFIAWHVNDFPHITPTILRYFRLPVLTWTVRNSNDQETASCFADQIIFEGFSP